MRQGRSVEATPKHLIIVDGELIPHFFILAINIMLFPSVCGIEVEKTMCA